MAEQHPHVVFAGGRTGGHLFPGLAVAARLTEDTPGARITFAGCGAEFERRHVAAAGFDYLALPCRPAPRRLRDVFPFLASNWAGRRQARWFLDDQAVSVVVGLGGYVSVPMAWAAVGRSVPLVLLEQNAVPGRATRWLARSAALVCTAFEQAHRHLNPHCTVRVTGNPIRAEFTRLGATPPSADDRHSAPSSAEGPAGNGSRRLLLVLGGSRGARSLNENVPRAFYEVRKRLDGWQIVHQSGQTDLEPTRALYRKLGLDATVVPFILDMPEVLARTHLALCRSGGTALAELAAAGVPAILFPYPHAANDHQRKNADVFTSSGGCLTLDERELAGRLHRRLAAVISKVLNNPTGRAKMSQAIRRLAHLDATWDVATMIRQLASNGGG